MAKPADIRTGMTVRDRDGERLGDIVAVDARGMTLEEGAPCGREHPLPWSEVTAIDGEDVYLGKDLASLPPSLPGNLKSRWADRLHWLGWGRPRRFVHELTGALKRATGSPSPRSDT
ncbi:hypothetical protein KRR26_08160 [Corallococcus sp. M34]|uniref:hypothetical protein n=1 Tax=Citreicoccus inhibens TaxID=2849499 RepID=UPI0011C377E6|nr:hypothetical protein [Citreicoccus inhibens]MBU8895576.1 hypothetical protein [Citreicoccus inhibens]